MWWQAAAAQQMMIVVVVVEAISLAIHGVEVIGASRKPWVQKATRMLELNHLHHGTSSSDWVWQADCCLLCTTVGLSVGC